MLYAHNAYGDIQHTAKSDLFLLLCFYLHHIYTLAKCLGKFHQEQIRSPWWVYFGNQGIPILSHFWGFAIRNSLHVVKSSSSIGLQFTILHHLLWGEPTVVTYKEVLDTESADDAITDTSL